MRTGFQKRFKLLAAGCVLCFAQAAPVRALAEEDVYPVIYGEMPESEDPVMELTEEGQEYTVLLGDCLWSIAEKLWGNGSRYQELFVVNEEILKSPDLIYPDMVLQTGQKGYIIRKEAKWGGIQMGEYSMDLPAGWTVGYSDMGDAFANFTLSGEGKIACLIRDKEEKTRLSVKNWEECTQKIRRYAEQNYKDSVLDLTFEHYQMAEQEEVYLYCYTYQMDLEDYGMEGKFEWKVCVGMKLTDHIQAEFVGFSNDDYDIHGCIRYVTASFEEHFKEGEEETFTVNDSNMQIVPVVEWEMEGMFNPFPWIEEYFSALLEKATGVSRDGVDKREELINRISRPIQ